MMDYATVIIEPWNSDAELPYTTKPVLSDYIKQYIFLAFQTVGCLLLHESSADISCILHELSALLSYSNKQPPVSSDFDMTFKRGLTVLVFRFDSLSNIEDILTIGE